MLSEVVCLDILRYMRGRTITHVMRDASGVQVSPTDQDAVTDHDIYRLLLPVHSLAELDTAMRWLDLSGYYSTSGFGLPSGISWRVLTDKGREAADRNQFSEVERELFYQSEDPHAVFVAHQFNDDDKDLVSYLKERVLLPQGFRFLEGRVDDLQEFRVVILNKIRLARFFVCLLTKRTQLPSGTYASSVWLYQETGVAVAYGKKPLLLVEEGIDQDYIGELQKVYEHQPFTRSNHPRVFDRVSSHFLADLTLNKVPRPTSAR